MIKCIVNGCLNHEHEGKGIMFLALNTDNPQSVWICAPCWSYITIGSGKCKNCSTPTENLAPLKRSYSAINAITADIEKIAVKLRETCIGMCNDINQRL